MNSSFPLFPCLWFYIHQEMAQDTLHVESQIKSYFSSKVATKLTSSHPTKMSLADIKRKTKNNRQTRWGITMILKQCRNSLLHWTYIAYFLIGLLSCNTWHVSSPDCTNYGTTFQADLDYLVVGFANKSVTYTDLQACKDACVAETTFVCRSVEIWKTGNVCYLSIDTAWTQPQAREVNVDYDLHSEPPRGKTNKMTVRPAKTQISLGIRPVWSGSSVCA